MGDTKLDKTEQLNCTSYCVKDGKGLAFLFEDRTEKKKVAKCCKGINAQILKGALHIRI